VMGQHYVARFYLRPWAEKGKLFAGSVPKRVANVQRPNLSLVPIFFRPLAHRFRRVLPEAYRNFHVSSTKCRGSTVRVLVQV